MKKCYILSLFALLLTGGKAFSQFNAAYHQSSLPFASVSYDFNRFHPDLRLSTDVLTRDLSAELTLNYKFINKDSYYMYSGLGFRGNNFQGFVLPVGLTVFPFERKMFGFHSEVAVIGLGNDVPALRGSWGIKVRFARGEE
ncbi:hypothetical protein [Pontibacter harenae]|uniref:hypothetical protein n=1 Tax=Pontibacter harenae TaxID=2894083 RepID=UPI001E534E62|nr:hypothetical protein [Pontibacter harenae]MCC9165587.1 hypothetical protein [Pontibacter harenae]